jgi:hypothetical protein
MRLQTFSFFYTHYIKVSIYHEISADHAFTTLFGWFHGRFQNLFFHVLAALFYH